MAEADEGLLLPELLLLALTWQLGVGKGLAHGGCTRLGVWVVWMLCQPS